MCAGHAIVNGLPFLRHPPSRPRFSPLRLFLHLCMPACSLPAQRAMWRCAPSTRCDPVLCASRELLLNACFVTGQSGHRDGQPPLHSTPPHPCLAPWGVSPSPVLSAVPSRLELFSACVNWFCGRAASPRGRGCASLQPTGRMDGSTVNKHCGSHAVSLLFSTHSREQHRRATTLDRRSTGRARDSCGLGGSRSSSCTWSCTVACTRCTRTARS